jgi:hypothetical protein
MPLNIDHCYLNIPRAERDWPLYRIISLRRLYELFEKRVNTLVKPVAWEDPFENFLRGLKGRLPSGELVEFAQRYDFYGQCWSRFGASDAMWRIYSSDKKSVRIKVRMRTLVETFALQAIGIMLVGKVRYLGTEGLLKWARRVIRDAEAPDVRLLSRTFFIKRFAFSHEREVRLLYFDPRGDRSQIFQYHVDPHTFVEQIVLDPRIKRDAAAKVIKRIRQRTGFRGPIVHSDLYAPPRELVLRLGAAYAAFQQKYDPYSERGKYQEDGMWIADYLPDGNRQIILPAGRVRQARS